MHVEYEVQIDGQRVQRLWHGGATAPGAVCYEIEPGACNIKVTFSVQWSSDALRRGALAQGNRREAFHLARGDEVDCFFYHRGAAAVCSGAYDFGRPSEV